MFCLTCGTLSFEVICKTCQKKLKSGGLIHKYEGRALVVATGACPVNCRYCFRRHFPYSDSIAARNHWQGTLDQLAADPSIEEVILSGGDPLSLSDEKLAELVNALDGLPQLRRLRVHTRQPVVLPERVDEQLLAWIRGTRLQVAIVIHANHANELDGQVSANLKQLRDSGAILLNQSVLLRGVNDTVTALESLSKRLFECGVVPYYLHLLDRVEGAAHFEVPHQEAAALMQTLSSRLSGYLVPRLVREDAGAPSKTLMPW
jgi:EF-P beta-lysylation protein EpmB